jgi:uncharacterized BrkB/YihY/UPF0761 family membrane protein
MNYVPPPPDEPPFMQELRDILDRIYKIDALIHSNVYRYMRRSKLVSIWLPLACGLMAGLSVTLALWINVWLLHR